MKFDRVWHPYYLWEEFQYGMWNEASDKKKQLAIAVKFTGDHKEYGKYMNRVINEWPISCENALTDYALNRRAWLGHAACALYARLPEHIVREAWGHLTDEQQLLANREASHYISVWERNYAKSLGLCEHMEIEML